MAMNTLPAHLQLANLSTSSAVSHRSAGPWPRARRSRWIRHDSASTRHLLAVIPSLPRCELAQLTMRLIDRMDEIDGDPDFELHGDERDGSMGEDDFHMQNQNWLLHPGCPLADPGEDSHDLEQDDTYE